MAVFRRCRLPWLSFRATSASSFFRFSSASRPPSPISWAFCSTWAIYRWIVSQVRYFLAPPPGGTSVSRIPSWVNCWTRRVVFPSSWAMAVELAHSGTVPVSTAGVVDLFGAVFFVVPATCSTPLFCAAGSFPAPPSAALRLGPRRNAGFRAAQAVGFAGFAFRLVVDFVFLTSFPLNFFGPHPL